MMPHYTASVERASVNHPTPFSRPLTPDGEREAKVEFGLAKGKKQHDRRASIKTREASREVERAMKGSRRDR